MTSPRWIAAGLAAALLVTAAACSSGGGDRHNADRSQFSPGFQECSSKPDECNSGERKQGGTVVFALPRGGQNWNILAGEGSLVENVTMINLISPSPYVFRPSGTIQQTDLVTEATVTSENPQVVTYKINPAARWDDGTPITHRDFEMIWRFSNGRDCPNCDLAGTTGYDVIGSIDGTDNGRTVKVTFTKPYPDWKGLFALFPAHVGVKAGNLNTPDGLAKAFEAFRATPTWSGWAYRIDKQVPDVQVEFVPNPNFYGKMKPTLDRIVFKQISDQKQNVPSLRNKEINGFVAQPAADMVEQLKALSPAVNYEMVAGFGWEHIDLNAKNKYLADHQLREAIFTAISVKDVIAKTLNFFPDAKQLGSHNLLPTEPGYTDVVRKVAPHQGSGDIEKAKKILTDAGYQGVGSALKTPAGEAVPELRFLYRVGIQTRAQTAEIVQSMLAKLGIHVKIETTSDLSKTLNNFDYDLVIFGWSGTPLKTPNRDLWVTGGGNNSTGWADPASDRLLDEMTRTLDDTKRRDLLNQQDEILTRAAVVLPLYAKPNLLALSSEYVNIRDNQAGSYVTYNVEGWGLKAG